MRLKFLILFLGVVIKTYSQEQLNNSKYKEPLDKVLIKLENKFNVRFSFSPKTVQNLSFLEQKKGGNLDSIINQIQYKLPLIFKKISHRYYIITPKNNTSILELQQLKEVYLKHYLTVGIFKNNDGSIKIKPQKLGILPGLIEPDILKNIQIIPGVENPNETASGLCIRGGTPDQNLILWDNITIYNSGHFFGMISAFNPYITKKVELFKNGISARYGNRISGVLDIKSKNIIPTKTKIGMGFNMIHADFYLQQPLGEKIGILVSARRSFNDLLKTFTFNSLSKKAFQNLKSGDDNLDFIEPINIQSNIDFHFLDYSAKITAKPSSNDEINSSYLFTKNSLDNNSKISQFNQSSQDKLSIKNFGFNTNWLRKWNKKIVQDLSISYSNYDFDYLGKSNYFSETLEALKKTNTINDLKIKALLNFKIDSIKTITYGYQFNNQKINYQFGLTSKVNNIENVVYDSNNFNSNNENSINTHAFIFEYEYNTKKWFANLGVRASYLTLIDKFYLEPRVNIKRKVTDFLSTKLTYEKRIQAISQIVEFQTSNFGFNLENKLWVLANNENIPILTSDHVSSSLLFHKNDWKIDTSIFFKNIQGITNFTRGYNSTEAFSLGKSKVFGAELLIHKKTNNVSSWLSYTYSNSKSKIKQLEINYFPSNNDVTHSLSISNTYKVNRFQFSLGWKLRSGVPFTPIIDVSEVDDVFQINYAKINSNRLPAYHRLDAATTYSFPLSKTVKAKLGISLLNIYNRKNILSRSYKIRTIYSVDTGEFLSDYTLEIDNISLGITPNIVFRVHF